MIIIGIIDDNPEQRDSFKDAIELYLKKEKRDGVKVIDREPLERKEDYITWIAENEVSVLIIDEKLADVKISTGKSCGYEGHEMAEVLRKFDSTIPIHVVTSSRINDDLKDNLNLFENVLSRRDFLAKQELWSEIFIRSGQNYYKEREKLFERISELSNLIVEGKATDSNISELRGLQEFFQMPLYSEEMMKRGDLIEEFQKNLLELKKINEKAKLFLKNSNE